MAAASHAASHAAVSDDFKKLIEKVLDKIQLPKSERKDYLHFGRIFDEFDGFDEPIYMLKNITIEDDFIDDLVASIKSYTNKRIPASNLLTNKELADILRSTLERELPRFPDYLPSKVGVDATVEVPPLDDAKIIHLRETYLANIAEKAGKRVPKNSTKRGGRRSYRRTHRRRLSHSKRSSGRHTRTRKHTHKHARKH
jgi:hypothetical protein